MGSFQIRSQTHVPSIGRRILIHCTTREVLVSPLRRCYKETPMLITSFSGDFRFLQGTLLFRPLLLKVQSTGPQPQPWKWGGNADFQLPEGQHWLTVAWNPKEHIWEGLEERWSLLYVLLRQGRWAQKAWTWALEKNKKTEKERWEVRDSSTAMATWETSFPPCPEPPGPAVSLSRRTLRLGI